MSSLSENANELQRALEKMPHGADIWSCSEITGRPLSSLLDFSANINPFVPRPVLREAVMKALDSMDQYPDPRAVRFQKQLSEKLQLSPASIILGNGAADLIFRLAASLRLELSLQHEAKLLLPIPSFSEYREAFQSAGFQIFEYPLRIQDHYQVDEAFLPFMESIRPQLLILCEPNNPSGQLTPPELFEKILLTAEKTGSIVLLDLSFLEFLPLSIQKERQSAIRKSKARILQLHSFTKFYAIPGLRLGFMEADDERLCERLKSMSPPWQISTPAMAAGMAALHFSEVEKEQWRQKIDDEKKLMLRQLRASGADFLSGEANFIFFHHPDEKLQLRLLKESETPCLIRSCANYPGLSSGFYRIGIQSPDKNRILRASLQKLYP